MGMTVYHLFYIHFGIKVSNSWLQSLLHCTCIVLVEIPYCLKNESSSKKFIKRFDKFTSDTFDVRIKWLTKKVKTLFKVKEKSLHQACKIYKGVCSCGESYIGETIKNVEVR